MTITNCNNAINSTIAMSPPTLRPEGYVPRLIDAKVDFMMSVFDAVCIEGPKGCGKTWTARNHAASEFDIADPSLSIAALNLTPEMLKNDLETYGFMFEAMCIRDLRVYADMHDATVYHYRDYGNLEVDAIMQFPDGRYGAFEIKLGDNQTEKAARNLLKFKEYTAKKGLPQPSALCVINGQSGMAYRRDDGATVVPITHLRE